MRLQYLEKVITHTFELAELFDKVLLLIIEVTAAFSNSMAPSPALDQLPEKVELLIVNDPFKSGKATVRVIVYADKLASLT